MALETAVKQDAYLQGADLRGADLRGAYLQGADLQGADLRGAYLQGADLRGAYLRGADLRGADLQDAYLQDAYLQGADLRGADLRGAYLQGADLQGAYLQGADLRGAYLQGADLRGADLRGAYLRDADLRGAENINKYLTTPLYMLLHQPGKIRAYKIINDKKEGIYSGGLKYKVGSVVKVDKWNTNEHEQCGAGISLATLDWCLREHGEGKVILLCEFTAKDIVAIPVGSDGKFRVKKCKVIRKLKPKEFGM
jgi:hypothetical protein